MQIILQEDVDKLGHRGDVVEVAEGYARNYLLPHNLGLPVSASNLKHLERVKVSLAKRSATERDGAQRQADLLNAATVTFERKAGENEQMFGSVTSGDISDALAAQGFVIDKRKLHLEQPIKSLGEFQIPVKLYRDVEASVKVVVSREK